MGPLCIKGADTELYPLNIGIPGTRWLPSRFYGSKQAERGAISELLCKISPRFRRKTISEYETNNVGVSYTV